MEIYFNKPTIYVSHPIRGMTGNIRENCKKASAAARRLRRVFPEVDFYVPAEHDLTLQILTADNRISIDDIMYADLQILRACHAWMYYRFEDSNGSIIEWDEAYSIGLTSQDEESFLDDVFDYCIEKADYERLRRDFSTIVQRAIYNFRRQKDED